MKFDTHTVLSRDEVLISFKILPLQVLLSSRHSARKVQLRLVRDLAFHLQNCRIQQKLHETHKICLWLERIRSSHKEFAYLKYNSTENTIKLTNFGILLNKTTSLFTSIIRNSKISRGCAKILEIPEGRGHKFWGPILENPEGRGVIRQIPSVGGDMDIFWNHTIWT